MKKQVTPLEAFEKSEALRAKYKDKFQFLSARERSKLTPEICLSIVQEYGHAVQYLVASRRTPEVCLAAVQQNGNAIQYLNASQRTPEICLAAMQQYGRAIWSLDSSQRTPEVCLAAVQQCAWVVEDLDASERTPEVCLAAVHQNKDVIGYLEVSERTVLTPEICLAAVQQDGNAIQYLNASQRTPEIWRIYLSTYKGELGQFEVVTDAAAVFASERAAKGGVTSNTIVLETKAFLIREAMEKRIASVKSHLAPQSADMDPAASAVDTVQPVSRRRMGRV